MKKIQNCLNKRLSDLCESAIHHESLTDKIKLHLPETLKDHVRVLSYQKCKLTLSLDASEFATELHYLLPNLRDTLRSQLILPGLSSIGLKITPSETPVLNAKKTSHTINLKNRTFIRDLLESLKSPLIKN